MSLTADEAADGLGTRSARRPSRPEGGVAGPDTLPERPLVSIRAGGPGAGLDPRELWAYRELFLLLAWRDVSIRYKQTALGAAWAIIQPLATMAIFTVLFGRLAGMPSDGIPYPLFAFAGLLPWTYFANAVTAGGNSLVGSTSLITKVYFPRLLIPSAAVAAGLVDLGVAFVTLMGLMAYYREAPGWGLLMLPVLVVLTTLLALGVSLWTSALNVKFRDVRHALPFVIQIWMFLSPVIYPASLVPPRWAWLLAFNPLSGLISGYRSALFGRPFDWAALATSAALTLALLACSAWSFRRTERSFADVV
jgi:lipopolysaccharide transport system permease protein